MSITRQPLPPDCLLEGRVHPSIDERLERIRQLPVTSVAQYLGLKREGEQYWLIWQAAEATPIGELSLTETQRAAAAVQVRHIVAAMHGHGIVHGNLTPKSIWCDTIGRVSVTHLSPLLYDDPRIDLVAIEALFPSPQRPVTETMNRQRPWRAVGATLLIGLLMFFALLWYSQPR